MGSQQQLEEIAAQVPEKPKSRGARCFEVCCSPKLRVRWTVAMVILTAFHISLLYKQVFSIINFAFPLIAQMELLEIQKGILN